MIRTLQLQKFIVLVKRHERYWVFVFLCDFVSIFVLVFNAPNDKAYHVLPFMRFNVSNESNFRRIGSYQLSEGQSLSTLGRRVIMTDRNRQESRQRLTSFHIWPSTALVKFAQTF